MTGCGRFRTLMNSVFLKNKFYFFDPAARGDVHYYSRYLVTKKKTTAESWKKKNRVFRSLFLCCPSRDLSSSPSRVIFVSFLVSTHTQKKNPFLKIEWTSSVQSQTFFVIKSGNDRAIIFCNYRWSFGSSKGGGRFPLNARRRYQENYLPVHQLYFTCCTDLMWTLLFQVVGRYKIHDRATWVFIVSVSTPLIRQGC